MSTTQFLRDQAGDMAFGLRYGAKLAERKLRFRVPLVRRVIPKPVDLRQATPLPAMGSTVTIDGIVMRIDPRMSDFNIRKLARGRHTSHERALLAESLRPTDRVLELGGGIGMVAIECARRIGSERVTTYEANPELESLTRENFALNDVAPELRMAMVGPEPGARTFHVSERFSQSSVYDVGPATRAVQVPVHDFARVLEDLRPTVLVVDIQGAERELFAQATFPGVRLILVELHPFIIGLSPMLRIRRRMRGLGFEEARRSGNSFVYAREVD